MSFGSATSGAVHDTRPAAATDTVSRHELLSSMTIGLGIAAGVWLLWVAVVNVVTVTSSAFSRRDSVVTNFQISEDGVPQLRIGQKEKGVSSDYLTDVTGNRLPDKQLTDETREFSKRLQTHLPGLTTNRRRVDILQIAMEQGLHSGSINEVWYLVGDRGSSGGCWLECWSFADNRRRVCLGTAGQTTDVPSEEHRFQIPDDRRSFRTGWAGSDYSYEGLRYSKSRPHEEANLYLAASNSIYMVNLAELSVLPLIETPTDFISFNIARPTFNRQQIERDLQPTLFLRSLGQLLELDLSGNVKRTLPLIKTPASATVHFSELLIENQPSKRHVWWTTSTRTDVGNAVELHLTEINDAGELSAPQIIRYENQFSGLTIPEIRTAIGLGLPTPLLLGGAAVVQAQILEGHYRTSPAAFTFCVLLTAFGVWLFHRHSQAHTVTHAGAWLIFILLLGLPGYLGYRCHRRPQLRQLSDDRQTASPHLPVIIAE